MKTKTSFMGQAKTSTVRSGTPAVQRKEILVPIDFSTSSVQALHHAAELAARDQAHLTLLNVIEEPASLRALNIPAQQRERQQQRADELRQLTMRELGTNADASIVVCEGQAATEIARVAASEHASVIVVGCHAHRGLGHWFRGNTAARLTRTAPCPVVLVNEGHAEISAKQTYA